MAGWLSKATTRVHLQFCAGIFLGFTVSFIFFGRSKDSRDDYEQKLPLAYRQAAVLYRNVSRKNFWFDMRSQAEWDKAVNLSDPVRTINFHEHVHQVDDTEARRLKKEVRVLIWVMTSPQNLQTKAKMVRDTWGRRANKLIFFSSETNKDFPTVGLDVLEGREHLTAKTMKGFRYVYEKHLDDADWFMKVDDDTYVIVENLRYFLSGQNTDSPVFFGHHFNALLQQGFYSGGAGYVLSKEALRRFGQKGRDPSTCQQDGGAEDVDFAMCMERLGVRTANTTDALGRSRFHCFGLETHLFGAYPNWYYQYDTSGAHKGMKSISEYAITFHYVPPGGMQSLEFLIYHLAPYGIVRRRQSLNRQSSPPSHGSSSSNASAGRKTR